MSNVEYNASVLFRILFLLIAVNVNSAASFSKWRLEGTKEFFHEEPRFKRDIVSFVPDINEIDTNTTFVEEVPNYPKDLVEAILKKEGEKLKVFFGTDAEIKTNNKMKRSASYSDTAPCQGLSRTAYPKAGETRNKSWKYIVQKERPIQGVNIEFCGRRKSCTLGSDVPSNFTSECVQNYKYHELVSLDEHGRFRKDEFKLPSSCVCVIKKT